MDDSGSDCRAYVYILPQLDDAACCVFIGTVDPTRHPDPARLKRVNDLVNRSGKFLGIWQDCISHLLLRRGDPIHSCCDSGLLQRDHQDSS